MHVIKFLFFAGIDSACSKFSCTWCKCSSDERCDQKKKWSLIDVTQGARTTEENRTIGSQSKKKFNVSNPPLFSSIPLKNVVIDNLHLFLRSSDVLSNLLVIELKRQDAIDKVTKFKKFDESKYKHLSGYQGFISSLKIPDFQFYVSKTSKALKCRSLTGPEKLKVMSNITIKNLLPHIPDQITKSIQDLWDNLLELNSIFSKKPEELTTEDVESFEEKARSWCKDFVECYHVMSLHTFTP